MNHKCLSLQKILLGSLLHLYHHVPQHSKTKKKKKTAVPLTDPRMKNCFIDLGPKIDLQNEKQDNTEVPLTDPRIKNCFVNIGPKIDSKKKKKK